MTVQTPHQPPVSNEDLAIKIDGLESRLGGRLDSLEGKVDKLEGTVKDSGLNGHTPLLRAFLEQYAATYQSRQAWLTVRQDISHRLRFLSSPRAWVKALLYAAIGGLGWKLVSGLPFPHL